MRLHKNGARIVREEIEHTPLDDLESSIWVLLWELYFHARENGGLLRGQLYIDRSMRHHSIYTMFAGMMDAAEYPERVFPQCPPINQFINTWLQYSNSLKDGTLISERKDNSIFGECYEQYFRALLECVSSDDGKLHQPWEQVFSSNDL